MITFKIYLSISIVICIAAILKVTAQENDDTLKVYKIPGIEIIGEKKFDAFRYTGSAYYVDDDELNLIQPIGTEEILKRLPGFNIASDDGISNRINVGIRGLYPRRSSRVLLMEDGVPVNPTIYLDPATYYNSPADRLDGLEVLKGSSALRYGPLTMGGVINYLTNRPPIKPTLSLKLTSGNHSYLSTYGTYGGTWNDVGIEVQALYKNFGGFRENTSSKMTDLTFKSGFRISEQTTLGAKINYFYENALATYSGLTKYSFETDPFFNPKMYDDLSAQRIALDIQGKFILSKNSTLTTTLYGNQYRRDWWRENDKFVKPDGSELTSGYSGPIVRIGNGKNVGRLRLFRMAGFEPRLKYNHKLFGLTNQFEAGIRFHAESFENKEINGDTSFSRSGSIDKDEYFAAFAFSSYLANKFSKDNFTLIPGLRIEYFKQQYNRYYNPVLKKSVDSIAENNTLELLPGISVSYTPENLNIYAGLHRGFTPPTLGTAFLNTQQVYEIAPGENNLDAEKSWNSEIGLKYRTEDKDIFEIVYFNLFINDMVDAGRDAVFQNLGTVRYHGIESAFSFTLNKLIKIPDCSFVLDGNYTFLDGKIIDATVIERQIATSTQKDTIDVSGNITPYSPKHALQLGIQTTFFSNLELRFDYKYVSEQYTDFINTIPESEDGSTGILPSYDFMNLSVRYLILSLGITTHFMIKNITNKIYRGSRVNRTSSGIFPDGFRQINIGLEWNY